MSVSFVRRTPVDVLEVDGEPLVLLGDRVLRLSPNATAVVGLTATPRAVAEVAVALEEMFGAPADGGTVDAAAAVVEELGGRRCAGGGGR